MQHQMRTEVFIVRIWKEPQEERGVPVVWRGAVEHVSSKAVRHIAKLGELLTFVRDTAGLGEDGSDDA